MFYKKKVLKKRSSQINSFSSNIKFIRVGFLAIPTLLCFSFVPLQAIAGENINYTATNSSALGSVMLDSSVTTGPVFNNSLFSATSYTGNTVNVTGGYIGGSVYGGIYGSMPGGGIIAEQNTVTISGGEIQYNVVGGWNIDNKSFNNGVQITGGKIHGKVYGGWVEGGTYAADFNTVQISNNAELYDNIYGGYSQNTVGAINNKIIISGGTFYSGVTIVAGGYGALSASLDQPADGNVWDNSVTISNVTMTNANIYGGRMSGSQNTLRNTVTLNNTAIGESVYGGQNLNGSGSVTGNTVIIRGGSIGSDVYGGQLKQGTGTANENKVYLELGSTVIGSVYGGWSDKGNVTDSIVNMSSGRINGFIYGGYIDDASTANTIFNSQVTIGNSARVDKDVYGGFSNSNNTSVINNIVNLSQSIIVGTVYGNNQTTWATDNNTLNVTGGTATVGSVMNFQTSNVLSAATLNIVGSSSTFQNLNNHGLISFYNGSLTQNVATILGDYSGSGTFGLEVLFGTSTTANDADSITFAYYSGTPINLTFKALTGSIASELDTAVHIATITDGSGGANAFRTSDPGYGAYAYEIFQESGNSQDYFLKLANSPHPDLINVHSEAAAAGLAQLTQSVSFLLLDSLSDSVSHATNKEIGISANMKVSKQKISTGSHVNLHGVAGTLALSWKSERRPLAFGIFGESFSGRYDTYNSATTNLGSYDVRSKGNIDNYGGGLFLQYRKNGLEKGMNIYTPGTHLELTARAGKSKMDFQDNMIADPTKYSRSSMYYGASIGGGHVFELNEKTTMDIFGHYVFTQMKGKSLVDNLGQSIDFKDTNSSMFILGTRFNYKQNNNRNLFLKLSMDWETEGKPKAFLDGHLADRASLSGVTGTILIGTSVKDKEKAQFNLSAFGSFGKRKGFGTEINYMYNF